MGIFDQSFITPEPKTDIKNQLIALAMRNEAINPEKVLTGLGEIGKVFTDAEANQQKANTAILQRRLDMLTPAQIEAMVTQGIDPITEAYKRDIPINVDDAIINKAWRDNIIDAQKEQGNKWVTTVLPTIPHEDKLKLLQGDTATFAKWGLTDFMRMDPALRTFIANNLKAAADRENERLYYSKLRKPTQQHVDEGTLPTDSVVELNPSGAIPDDQKNKDTNRVLDADDESDKAQAALGINSKHPWSKYDHTGTRLSAKAARMVDEWIAYHGVNPDNDENDFIKQYDFEDEPEENKLKIIHEFSAAIRNQDKQGEYTIGQSNVTPGEYTRDVTSLAGQEEAVKYINAQEREGNTKAKKVADKKLTDQINQDIEKSYYKKLFTALRNGVSQAELTTLRDRALQTFMRKRNTMSEDLYKKYDKAIKDTFDRYIEQAGKNEADHEANRKHLQDQARNRIMGYSHGMYKDAIGTGASIQLPTKKLSNSLVEAIKNTFFKSTALQNAWDTADPFTREVFLYEALNHVGLINDLRQMNADKPEELLQKINNHRSAKSGITDESFVRYLQDINLLDINNSIKKQRTREQMEESVASNSTK